MQQERVLVNSRYRTRVRKLCCVCRAPFFVQPSKQGRIQSCPACRRITRQAPARLQCRYCRQPFVVKGHLRTVQKYCSRTCKWNAATRDPTVNYRNRKPQTCLECGSSFYPTKTRSRYCSLSCFTQSSKRAALFCAHCQQPFTTKRNLRLYRRVFCSRRCYGRANCGAQHSQWLAQRPPDDRGPGWQELAESIRQRDHYQCQRCGEKQNGRRLDVHHIEPYRLRQNNQPSNLLTLCVSCHKIVESAPARLLAPGSHPLRRGRQARDQTTPD